MPTVVKKFTAEQTESPGTNCKGVRSEHERLEVDRCQYYFSTDRSDLELGLPPRYGHRTQRVRNHFIGVECFCDHDPYDGHIQPLRKVQTVPAIWLTARLHSGKSWMRRHVRAARLECSCCSTEQFSPSGKSTSEIATAKRATRHCFARVHYLSCHPMSLSRCLLAC